MEKNTTLTFSWIDYVLFFLMFAFTSLIGIYHGCYGKNQSITDYLLGGRKMNALPVAMSLIISYLSGITLLGTPAEIYLHGAQYFLCLISVIISTAAMLYLFLPVFHNLQITSCYEYLEMRFDYRIRLVASFLYLLLTFLYIPVVLYVPAMTFNQVTGINMYYVTPSISMLCIFCTAIGGLKAVVWIDALQFSVTLIAMCIILYLGIVATGGISNVWEIAEAGGRIEFFNLNPDPTVRSTFWGVTIGTAVTWIAQIAVGPSYIQRFLSLPSMSTAKLSTVFMSVGIVLTKYISIISGIVMYAKYSNCDPLTARKVERTDQLVPYHIFDVGRFTPGIAGLFISGIFSATLSTMSTHLNTLAATVYYDFLKPHFLPSTTDARAKNIMKLIVVVFGVICTIIVFFVEKLEGIMKITFSFTGVTCGPLLGIFSLGMLFPFANTKGCFFGGFTALTLMSWILIGSHVNHIRIVTKPLSVANCEESFDNVSRYGSTKENTEGFWLYRISFYWFSTMGALITLVVGILVSWLTDDGKRPEDPSLLAPCVRRFLVTRKDYQKVKLELQTSHV